MDDPTFGGWTIKEIQEAENNGEYIPRSVLIDYDNGDTDEDNERERQHNWN